MTKKRKVLLMVVVLVAAIAYLITTGMKSATYFLTPGEIADSEGKYVGKPIRVGGKIIGGSDIWDSQNIILTFTIYDEKAPDQTMKIVYKGIRPDNFKEATGAIVEGTLDSDGVLNATKLMLQCPSKYEADPNAPKKTGVPESN
jgi:cytochrome c-type biogenesis protein CcmE